MEYTLTELAPFMTPEGQLTALPVKHKKKLAALADFIEARI